MNNMYRIQTLAGGQRLNKVRDISRLDDPNRYRMPLDVKLYLDGLSKLSDHDSVSIFEPQYLHDKYIFRDLVVKIRPGYEFPDVWTLGGVANSVVSEKVKSIIQKIDGDIHQFRACNIFNNKGELISGSKFYFLHVRRLVKVEGFSSRVKHLPNLRIPIEEREYFTAVEESQAVKNIIGKLPIWGVHRSYFAFHVSESVMQIFRDNQITGLKNYSKPYGVAGEGVVAYG